MRHQSHLAKMYSACQFAIALSLCVFPIIASAQSDCITNALSGYRNNACILHIDRKNLASPPAMIVPKGTTVTLELDNVRWDETIQFNPVTTQNTDQDVLATVLKTILPSLQVLSASQTPSHGIRANNVDPITEKQKEISKLLTEEALKINNTFTELTCFESYKALLPIIANKSYACSLTPLVGPLPAGAVGSDTYTPAKDKLISNLHVSAALPLPLDSETEVDDLIKPRLAQCQAATTLPADKATCYAALNPFQTNQDLFKNIVSALEKTQQALETDAKALETWPGTDPIQKWSLVQTRNRTSTVTIVATEIIAATPATLGTVSITWQTQPFVLSTGILLSTLSNRSYAISQVIVNGLPKPDPIAPTKYLTQITESDVKPSVVFPMVYGNYRIGPLSRAEWENHCWNHCAFLISGGIGANLTGKTAEFAFGPSFQIGSVLFTPAAHVGRESRLTNGFYVGEQLGSSPPSALTTENKWTTHLAFSLTYVIPIP